MNHDSTPDPDDPSTPVTLINSFTVAAGRDDAFRALWTATSTYFRGCPGFVDLRLHRAVDAGPEARYVNVARWASAQDFADAHAGETFQTLVRDSAWQEFPSSPRLYRCEAELGPADRP
ncbi:antibiotic biosynthesis monooxygenase [Gordonia sp. TBRC 11910]|uniref:Antibiotic biosynthesis monooxygenase n=1 Tax=Gordonia asplenii TaxID=2725283 RepID=A0A848L2R6_9ACTN|nr:antibiotic biosynthesis monooxygenase family protein [Gordonia asplenii]NMO04722.1 antibiotic biosynthesis monooxygenase [Gordonia asplenii]